MEFVLVSSCLIGSAVRYNGTHKKSEHAIFLRWMKEGRVVASCPEVAGGMPVPRAAAEIVGVGGGSGVLLGAASVMDAEGNDVSTAFTHGARLALRQAQAKGIRIAVLKEDSPSCGSSSIYDGAFSGNRVAGRGVTTALLESAGVRVFSETQWVEADAFLCSLETSEQ
ncbi:MAG: DUF523 domain-containing protein [Comamonas sp.]|jgi:uncharacterized protein YbbK (DUF523 family)|uniref:DUF523 domain-containing protein n=1 Tax=Comamonas sp. TaxID=34028 RepID=UPI002816ADA5|nr:DUF523 domain-containing protein [Comamonas sp.]MDR0214104.1 DUF523 domain-containing protein [Comamonas sp.]